jgi:large subunit ribosomal protein L7/L12
MKLIKKLSAGFLVTLGSICLLAAAYAPFNHDISPEEQRSEAIACLLFGLPLTGVGGWMAWRLHQQGKNKRRDRLQSIFYELLKQSKGQITVLQLAMEAKLSGTEARQFLNEQAREFNANFEVNDQGEIFYFFNIGATYSQPQYLEASNHTTNKVDTALPKKKKRKRKRGLN